MGRNPWHGLFIIRNFVHKYIYNMKTKGHIRTFYLSDDRTTINDIYSLGYSCM